MDKQEVNRLAVESWFLTLPWLKEHFKEGDISRVSTNILNEEILNRCPDHNGFGGYERKVLLFAGNGTLLGEVGKRFVSEKVA